MTNATASRNGAAEDMEDEDEDDLEGRVSTAFSTPIAMKVEIEKAAKAANLKPSDFVRSVVAKAIGYTLPAKAVKPASQTDEEKKAAAQAAAAAHRARMRELLNKHRAAAGLPVSDD